MTKLLSLVPCVLVLSGCVQLLPDPPTPPRLYPLEPAAVTSARGAAQTLIVDVPTGPALALGEEIVWRRDGVLGVMSDASWSDRADVLLQRILVHAFGETDAEMTAVLRGGSVRADYELQTDITQFEIVEEQSNLVAVFTARAMFIDARTRRLLRADTVEVRSPVATRSASVAAEALQRSAREGAAQLTARLVAPAEASE